MAGRGRPRDVRARRLDRGRMPPAPPAGRPGSPVSGRPVPVAVTGGAGFIGSHVSAALAAVGHRVLVVDDLSSGSSGNLASVVGDIDMLRADIAGPELAPALKAAEVQVVCHLAAAIDVRASVADPVQDALRNVVGTVAVLQAAYEASAGRWSSRPPGGRSMGRPQRHRSRSPRSSRRSRPMRPARPRRSCGCKPSSGCMACGGRRWPSANVYGPRQDPAGEAGVISLFASRMLAGLPTTIYGDGGQTSGLRQRRGRGRRLRRGLRAPGRRTVQHRRRSGRRRSGSCIPSWPRSAAPRTNPGSNRPGRANSTARPSTPPGPGGCWAGSRDRLAYGLTAGRWSGCAATRTSPRAGVRR